MKKNKNYLNLLGRAARFNSGFALVLVKSSKPAVQQQWMERLERDLEKEDIKMVHITGDDWDKNKGNILTPYIKEKIPSSGGWILSLSRFDRHMMPQFPDDLKNRDQLPGPNKTFPHPPLFLRRLNYERDGLIKNFPVPFLLWLSHSSIKQIAEYAPDFFDFRNSVIDLT